jgi:ABC-type taurine transport system ATPase subunit
MSAQPSEVDSEMTGSSASRGRLFRSDAIFPWISASAS